MKTLMKCYDLVAEKCNSEGNLGKLLFSERE